MSALGRREGFSLLSAIFLLVVTSAVGASMLSLTGAERRTASLGVLGTRAYQAARSGAEWGIAKVVADSSACASGTFSLSEGGLAGFSVTVTCAFTDHRENPTNLNVFTITSVADYGSFGDADYVSRQVETTVTVAQ